MRVYIAICVLVAALAAFLLGRTTTEHVCSAPCTVAFSAPMEEDEFDLDYRDGKVYIKKIVP